jgi:hypothetical protein
MFVNLSPSGAVEGGRNSWEKHVGLFDNRINDDTFNEDAQHGLDA